MCDLSVFECEHGTLRRFCIKCKPKTFDITKYEFSDTSISKVRIGPCGDIDLMLAHEYINLGEDDAEAIAKHFKLL